MEFEDLLCRHRAALERFVRFRIPVPADAEDIIQDTCVKAFERYGKRWSEQLPDSETLTVNGVTYVHWYDCVTDHIL